MSERRSISFNKNESELLKFYDTNGKSDIVKVALKFYIENKENVINEATLNILKILNFTKPIQNTIPNNNISKLKK
jgi:hypothetical protein